MNVRVRKSRRRFSKPPVGALPADAEGCAADDYQVKVALAAYFIAERRGFEPGHELDDWLAAEAEISQSQSPHVTKPIQLVEAESIS